MTNAKKTNQNSRSLIAPMMIELTQTVTLDGVDISTLTLRRPKVRDMLAIEQIKGTDAQKELQLFANLCEVTPECLHELDMLDYGKLQKAYQDFLS